jgi:prevent-host-death family protein
MEKQWQLQEAKAKFSELVTRAQKGETQIVTKHGEPAVVLMNYAEYQRLSSQKMSAREALRGPPGLNAFEGMTDEEIDALFARPKGQMRLVDL